MGCSRQNCSVCGVEYKKCQLTNGVCQNCQLKAIAKPVEPVITPAPTPVPLIENKGYLPALITSNDPYYS